MLMMACIFSTNKISMPLNLQVTVCSCCRTLCRILCRTRREEPQSIQAPSQKFRYPLIWEFPKIGGTLFCWPFYKDPTLWGTILGSPTFGDSHIPTLCDKAEDNVILMTRNTVWSLGPKASIDESSELQGLIPRRT